MKKYMLLIVSLSSFCIYSAAQDCTVSAEALKGKYEGDCNKGKAEGKGTATGIDSYTGEFKKGYPDGEGKYTWKNGNWYQGTWKKGNQNGKGAMHYLLSDGKDSVLNGFWKNGTYTGVYEKPYYIHYRGSAVHDIRFTKNSKSSSLQVEVKNSNTTGSAGGRYKILKLSNFEVKEGSFNQMQKLEDMGTHNFYDFRNVEFPFRIQLYFEKYSVDVEIYEPGDWTVDVEIND